jgi:hypothetical protein
MEQLDYNLLFRWFVGLEMDELVWNHSTFSKNRDRLNSEFTVLFFASIRDHAAKKKLISDEHFTVDFGKKIERTRKWSQSMHVFQRHIKDRLKAYDYRFKFLKIYLHHS